MYKFLIPLFALAFLLVSCNPQTTPTPNNSSSSMSAASTSDSDALAKAKADNGDTVLSGKHTVILKTSMGDITMELDADAAPKTVTNFVALAKAGYYDNLLFHRVIPDFMVQAGDPEGNGTGGESIYGENFADEMNAASYGLDKKKVKDVAGDEELPPELANLTLKELYERQGFVYSSSLTSLPMTRGAIAMANRGPNTNGSQFFIIQSAGTPWLEGKHTVFGKVTKGMDIVDKIVKVPRDGNDMPEKAVTYTVEVK